MKQLNDQYFNYRQTPVDYDGVAKPSIKGNTLVWNQLFDDPTFTTDDGWASVRTTISVSGNTLTGTVSASGTAYVARETHFLGGQDKYLFSFDILTSFSSDYVSVRMYAGTVGLNSWSGYGSCVANTLTRINLIVEANTTVPYDATFMIYPLRGSSLAVGDTYAVRNLNIYNLSKTYGSGNEPTLEQFTSLFSLPMYAYDSGSLLNFNGTGIKTTGKNLLDVSSGTGAGSVAPTYANGILEIKAMTAGTVQIWLMDFPLYETKTYTLSFDAYASEDGTRVIFDGQPDALYNAYGSGGLGYDKQIDVSTTKTRYTYSGVLLDGTTGLRFFRTNTNAKATTSAVYISNIQLEFGSSASSFEPYTTSTTSLPISTYFPTGMKSIDGGRVYDELSDKAITRIGSIVADGTLDYAFSASDSGNWATINLTGKLGKVDSAKIQLISSNTFTPIAFNDRTSASTIFRCYINDSGNLVLRLPAGDTTFTNSTGAKTYFTSNPVYLNYELATYTEQDVNADLFYKFYGDGTEQLLPVNTDTPSTSPLLADIIYYNLTDSEVPYRVFWMINSKGERWDFTEREFKSFLNNPQGLGFSKTFSVNRYGNVQNLTDITDNFPQPNGEVLFYDSSNSTRYDKYNNFVKFLSYEPITLYYKIPVSFFSRIPNTYSLECVVGTLSKTESKTDHMLTCSINYNALSFYKGEEVEISGTGTSYTINNDSDFPIGFEITITGSPVNPYFTLTQDGEMYGEAKFDDSTAFSSVYVNSNDGEQNVELQQGGSVLPNPLSYQDLSISNGSIYVTFVKLARGESTLTIGKDSGSITGVNIKFTPIYRSV